MRDGFIRRDGMLIRQTKNGETLYESVRVSDSEVIDYIRKESKATGLSPTKVIATMVTRFYYENVKK